MAAVSLVDNDLMLVIRDASDLNCSVSRLDAVHALKALTMSREVAQSLCDLLVDKEHPAIRAAAAQVLGYHQAAVGFSEVKAEVLRRAGKEADPRALQAMVFALQQTDGIVQFFEHECEAVGIEAVMGAPVQDISLQGLLDGVVGGVGDAVAKVMCMQLGNFENITARLVACLMAVDNEPGNFGQRVLWLFEQVPQHDLLDALTDVSGEIERSYQTIWPGIWRREQQRKLLEIFTTSVTQHGASSDLVTMLVERIGYDAAFYDRYMRFVRLLVAQFAEDDALALVQACQRVATKPDREILSRLAEMLVELSRSVPGVSGHVLELLGGWEEYLPGVRLKAFHAAR